jgi:3-oxoacyl-[acyl-carrier-protein] synthase-3
MTVAAPVRVLATGAYVPERVVLNSELEDGLGLEAGWIEKRTGIRERRFANDEQATSDLATQACLNALETAGLNSTDIDLIVCATSTPDWPQPATAAAIHGQLNMREDAGSFDVDAVCSGFVYAFHTAASMLATDTSLTRVLVVGADCYSRITDPTDRRTRVLFGDGAGAVLLESIEYSDTAPGVLATAYGTSPSRIDSLVVPAGGSRNPVTPDAIARGLNWFAMNGPDVRDFAMEHMPHALRTACERAGIDVRNLDLIVPHQSNLRILETAIADAGLAREQVSLVVDRTGNTAAASIPIALDAALRERDVAPGALVGIVGYGGGLSWAAAVVRWG